MAKTKIFIDWLIDLLIYLFIYLFIYFAYLQYNLSISLYDLDLSLPF